MNNPKKEISILESKDGKITVIKYGDLIFGVGDIIKHYNSSHAEIIRFEINNYGLQDIVYYYDTISLDGKDPYPDSLRLREYGKHASSISNIVGIVQLTDSNKKFSDKWWKKENLRRSKLPRYKVISDYPYSQYKIGQILEAYNTTTWTIDKHLVKWYDKFPKIFERIKK